MVSKLHRNAIISGWIDFFCLVCDSYFETEEEAEVHTHKQTHKANLEETTYLEKYKHDLIRKVKAGYFCEYCNVLLSTNTKVNLHVEEKSHIDNRGFAIVKYVDEDVAFNNVLVREQAWHGFSGDTCAICNCDVDDYKEHKNKQSHLLNLVQGSIHFGPNKLIYRHVDESSFQCLTCNKILSSNSFAKHSADPEHEAKYASCIVVTNVEVQNSVKEKKVSSIVNTKDVRPQNPPTVVKESTDTGTVLFENKSDILDLIPLFQANDINIDLITEKVFCKKCCKNMNFECNEILKHIDEHKNSSSSSLPNPGVVEHSHKATDIKHDKEMKNKVTIKSLTFYTPGQDKPKKEKKERMHRDSVSKDDEKAARDAEAAGLESYAVDNKLIYVAGNNEAYCSVCDVKIIATLKNMTKHVKGAIHKVKSVPGKKMKSPDDCLPKMRMKEFVKTVIHVQKNEGHDVIVNDKYCLHANSFLMIHEQGTKLRCLSCEITFDESDIRRHLKTDSHDGSMDRTPIVLLDSTEFVREVRPGQYHCGWCHLVVGDWSTYEEHAKLESHAENKAYMKTRMAAHLPEITEHRRMGKRKQ